MAIGFLQICRAYGAVAGGKQAGLSLFDHLNSSKTIEKLHFTRTNRVLAVQMDLCPHGRKAGSHGTANCPHETIYWRTELELFRTD